MRVVIICAPLTPFSCFFALSSFLSGGLSNELNNIIGRYTNGVYEGVAIGGDKYPGSTFVDHLLRYEANPEIAMSVVLGEVGRSSVLISMA